MFKFIILNRALNNGRTTISTTSDIDKIGYFTNDKWEDILIVYIYDSHIYVSKFGNWSTMHVEKYLIVTDAKVINPCRTVDVFTCIFLDVHTQDSVLKKKDVFFITVTPFLRSCEEK